MKKNLRPPALLAGLLCATALLAYETGGVAYTKRVETKLLAEPMSQAEVAGRLPFARKVKIEEVKGAWLRVSDGPTAGWIFGGNLADLKPIEGKGADGLGLAASTTTATAAARPLSPAAIDYAASRNLASAQADFDWMTATCSAITPAAVDAWMQEKKLGEFQ